jgi:hypothetical protein
MRFRVTPRLAISSWLIALVVVAAIVTVGGKPGKLYRTFVAAGGHFRNGETIYGELSDDLDLFRYSPLVAAAMSPLAMIPTDLGAVLWRGLQAAILLVALRAWARVAVPNVPWPALAILALPLCVGNMHNGQLNPLVASLMLFAAIAFVRERYWLAAAAIAGAALFKIYPLSLGLLFCIIEPRRFTIRLLVAAAIGCLAPFALQSPDYVAQQFADWMQLVSIDNRTNQPIQRGYHDFQRLLLRWGVETSLDVYRGIEIAAGCAAAAFVIWARNNGHERTRLVHACVSLGFVWCTLFGPATESATYMLLAPVVAHAALAVRGRPAWERYWVRGAYLLLLSSAVIQWFPRPVVDAFRGAVIPQAHAALLLLGWIVWQMAHASTPSCIKRTRSLERFARSPSCVTSTNEAPTALI